MPKFVKHFVQDLTQDIKIRQCGTIVFNADDEANVIAIDLYNGEEPAALTGSVVGAVICSDGSTVPVTGGTISGNTVTLTLTGDCGAIPGPIGVGVQIVNGTQKTTVLKAVYNVEPFTTDNVVDPGSRITITVSDLVQDIADAVATIPADYTDLLAAVAPNYSGLTFPVKVGTLCWYNGALYQAKQDIATSESWTAAHWDSAVLSTSVDGKIADVQEEVSGLKSAITEPSYNLYAGKIAGATINSSGKIGSSTLFDMFKAPVVAGKTYSARLKSTTESSFIAYFENEPTATGDVSYNGARIALNPGVPFTAPITGWVVYRDDIGFDQPQVNEGVTLLPYAGDMTAKDYTARAKLDAIDGIETGSMNSSVVPVVSTGAGKYVKNDGSVDTNNALNMSDPIDLAPGFTITVNAAGSSYTDRVAIIASVSDGVYTPLVLNTSGNTPAEYTHTAQTAEQIVLSYLVSAGITASIAGNMITAINMVGESVNTMDNSVAGTPLSMFTDIVCCGDSLTYSAVFTDATHHRQAFVPWPTQIQRVYGIPTDIKADSGKNPKTWFADYGDTIAQSTAGNRLYITYFGHNASEQYPYTDTFETDCPADADPSTWADTLTGWWGRIINDIYAAGCKALIIRVSDSNGYRETQDAIIEDIAARWNVPVIDNPYLPDLMYHSATDSYANESHYNDLGYMAFCRQLLTNINRMGKDDLGHLLPSNE